MTRVQLLHDLLANPRAVAESNWSFARQTWEKLDALDDIEIRCYIRSHFYSGLERAGLRYDEFISLELMRLKTKLDALEVRDDD